MHVHFVQLKIISKSCKELIQDLMEINGKPNFQQYAIN